MGRNKLPSNVIKMRGKTNIGKSTLLERESCEVKADSDKVKAPKYLRNDLKKEFNLIAKELKKLNILSNLDVDSLARFIIARHMYIAISDEMLADPIAAIENEKLIMAQDKFFKQCRQCATDMGLTITSRCKLVIPKPIEEAYKQSEEERLFGEYL